MFLVAEWALEIPKKSGYRHASQREAVKIARGKQSAALGMQFMWIIPPRRG
jgi:hypothetical protein